MTFASPLVLLALAAVPVLVALWLREARVRGERIARLVDAGLLDGMVEGTSPARRTWRRALAVVGFAVLVVAAAGPQIGSRTILLPAKGLDILFIMDVSRSMRARDVLPDRLERAKAEIADKLDHLAENRIGIVAFAGTAFVQCPLTTDKEAVRLFLRDLAPESVPQGGTSLVAGLEVALRSLEAEAEAMGGQKPAGRVVVVVTDGEDHEGGIDEIAKELREAGVTIVLIGVGSSIGEPIPVVDKEGAVTGYLKDRAGNTVMTRMNGELMAQTAQLMGGAFVDGTNLPDLGLNEVEARVRSLEKRDLEARTHVEREDRTTLFLLAALALLLLAVVLPERARSPHGSALP